MQLYIGSSCSLVYVTLNVYIIFIIDDQKPAVLVIICRLCCVPFNNITSHHFWVMWIFLAASSSCYPAMQISWYDECTLWWNTAPFVLYGFMELSLIYGLWTHETHGNTERRWTTVIITELDSHPVFVHCRAATGFLTFTLKAVVDVSLSDVCHCNFVDTRLSLSESSFHVLSPSQP